MAEAKIDHDRKLFEIVLQQMLPLAPSLRAGAMFGCPAAFVDGRLAFCVFGAAVGMKLPERRAQELLQLGKATAFRPFGRPPMRRWVQVLPAREDVADFVPLLVEAVAYARES